MKPYSDHSRAGSAPPEALRFAGRAAFVLALLGGCSGSITAPDPGSGGSSQTTGSGGSSQTTGSGGTTSDSGGTRAEGGDDSGAGAGKSAAGGSGDEPSEEECATDAAKHAGRTPLRRLTRSQYDHTVRDLLNVTDKPSLSLAADEQIGPFASNAISPVTDLIVQQYQEVAVEIAAGAQARMSEITPCDLTSGDECVRRFVTEFGRRAYRRPLDSAEIDAYAELFAVATDAPNGFRLILEAMLQSPFFLHHADVGVEGEPSSSPVALTPFELASRLSYFIWDSMPDAELDRLADDGSISDPDVLAEQVERMLEDDKAKDAIPSFHLQWLAISPSEFGTLAQQESELSAAMLAETSAFTDYVVREGDGLLSTLLTANFSFPEGPLFDVYGMREPDDFTPGMRVTLDEDERGGVLTQPAFLVKHYRGAAGSVVHRGITIRENLLCQPIEPPPLDVATSPLPPVEGTTARDRFRAHEEDPTCGGCHSQMDPIGLALENYDGVGRYRETDGGVMIDASGEIFDAGEDLAGTFVGGVELGQKLAGSRTVRDCVANQWFRFALGRMESNDDACTLRSVREKFAATANIRELITDIVLGDAFRNVRAVGK
jgi:hypothetical protein